ncbi:MAG: LIC_13355 family lipoprotein [Proteobacteria bacterium]|nr:MAG: LIC_13355 family lipoprotein [Pseudomonadota bacterium]
MLRLPQAQVRAARVLVILQARLYRGGSGYFHWSILPRINRMNKLCFAFAIFAPELLKAQVAGECLTARPEYADVLVQATGAAGVLYSDPQRAVNGVRGGGLYQGSTDVFSLDKTIDGTLIVAWTEGSVCDGPGADVAVFENGFRQRISNALFFEPVIVSVSIDGVNYEDFPHSFLGSAALADVVNEKNWLGFAGMSPVLYNEETNNFDAQGIDPLDATLAGGDGFDITTLPDTPLGLEIKASGFRYLRLVGAPAVGFPTSPIAYGGYADIDGIYAKRFVAPVSAIVP